MKKLLLLTVSVLFLFTACSISSLAENNSESEELDYETLGYEKLKDGVYVDYDRTRFENVTAPKAYYAECVTVNDSDLRSYFSLPQYHSGRGSVFAGTECCNDLSILYVHRYVMGYDPLTENLDFMPLSELYTRFENDTNKFVSDVRIHDMLAITAEEFAETAAEIDPPDPERGWSEPKDFYFIRARQYVDDIPIFAGISPTNVDTLFHNGSVIEACYSEDGIEKFDARGLYTIVEEASVNGTFIDLSGAEQIIRDQYELIYPYHDLILVDCDLVYVAVFEGDRTVLTPAWEFYKDYGPSRNWYLGSPPIRINAYTGEFMRGS